MSFINLKVKKVYYELLNTESTVAGLKTVVCQKDVPAQIGTGCVAYAGKEYEVMRRSKGWAIHIKGEPGTYHYEWMGYEVELRSNDAFYKRTYRKKSVKKEEYVENKPKD